MKYLQYYHGREVAAEEVSEDDLMELSYIKLITGIPTLFNIIISIMYSVICFLYLNYVNPDDFMSELCPNIGAVALVLLIINLVLQVAYPFINYFGY